MVYSKHFIRGCSPRIANHVAKEMVVMAEFHWQNAVSKSIICSVMKKIRQVMYMISKKCSFPFFY